MKFLFLTNSNDIAPKNVNDPKFLHFQFFRVLKFMIPKRVLQGTLARSTFNKFLVALAVHNLKHRVRREWFRNVVTVTNCFRSWCYNYCGVEVDEVLGNARTTCAD